jgi:hypothetical protein
MPLELEVRGVGKRSGIFFAGRPATLLAFDDAIVLLPASTLGGLLGAQGAVGAAGKYMRDRKETKGRAATADDLTSADFAGRKRARVIPYAEITAARLDVGRVQNKLVLETGDSSHYLRYPKKLWPEEQAAAFLREHVGDRFAVPRA